MYKIKVILGNLVSGNIFKSFLLGGFKNIYTTRENSLVNFHVPSHPT